MINRFKLYIKYLNTPYTQLSGTRKISTVFFFIFFSASAITVIELLYAYGQDIALSYKVGLVAGVGVLGGVIALILENEVVIPLLNKVASSFKKLFCKHSVRD